MEAELPLQQLIQGLGRCGQKVDVDVTASQDHQATNGKHFKENVEKYWKREIKATDLLENNGLNDYV